MQGTKQKLSTNKNKHFLFNRVRYIYLAGKKKLFFILFYSFFFYLFFFFIYFFFILEPVDENQAPKSVKDSESYYY